MTTKDTKNARQGPSRESSALQRRTQTRGPNPSQGQNPATASASATAPGPPPPEKARPPRYTKHSGEWDQKCLALIPAFPCVGKSTAQEKLAEYYKEKKWGPMPWTVDDLDPTEYYREKTDEWLEYYVHVIMTKAQNANAIVLFSAHKEVQLAVLKAKGKFMRVRPRPDALDTYLGREATRNKKDSLLYKFMKKNWLTWHKFEKEMNKQNRAIVLGNTQHLSDAITFMHPEWVKDWRNGGTERYAVGEVDLEEMMGIKGMS